MAMAMVMGKMHTDFKIKLRNMANHQYGRVQNRLTYIRTEKKRKKRKEYERESNLFCFETEIKRKKLCRQIERLYCWWSVSVRFCDYVTQVAIHSMPWQNEESEERARRNGIVHLHNTTWMNICLQLDTYRMAQPNIAEQYCSKFKEWA